MTLYEPHQTREWSTRELAALIGKHITWTSAGAYNKPTEGVVADAGVSRFGQAWIEFADGSSVQWDRCATPAAITVAEPAEEIR